MNLTTQRDKEVYNFARKEAIDEIDSFVDRLDYKTIEIRTYEKINDKLKSMKEKK